MATLLRRLRVTRVDLVDKGANYDPASGEGAHVLLYKRADMPTDDCDLCKAELSGESRGELSDADFAAVWVDSEGRKQRKLPLKDAAHVRNALARFNQTDMPADVRAKAKSKLERAKAKFGIGDEAKKGQPNSTEVNVDDMTRCKKCDAYMKKASMKCPKCGAEMEPDADDASKSINQEETMADNTMKADLDAATAKVDSLTKANAELQTKLDAYEKDPAVIEKRKLEALPESVRKRIEESEAKVAKMESEAAEREMTDVVKRDMASLPGKHDESGKLLKRVKDAVSKEDFEALNTMLKAASEQIAKGKLFSEKGTSGDGPANDKPISKIDAAVAEKIAKGADRKLTKDQALAELFAEQPDLYAEYARSVTADVNRRSSDAN